MDTRIIEVRKNIIIKRVLTAETEFDWTINTVNFIPDEVNVKMITYVGAVPEADVSGIYTDMVQDIIGSFFDGVYVIPKITFTLKKPIFGLYNFQFLTGDRAVTALSTRSGDLFIHLEFIKYKEDNRKVQIY
jgi:hypothetical protein